MKLVRKLLQCDGCVMALEIPENGCVVRKVAGAGELAVGFVIAQDHGKKQVQPMNATLIRKFVIMEAFQKQMLHRIPDFMGCVGLEEEVCCILRIKKDFLKIICNDIIAGKHGEDRVTKGVCLNQNRENIGVFRKQCGIVSSKGR